jgi:hypothetical protein
LGELVRKIERRRNLKGGSMGEFVASIGINLVKLSVPR